MYQSMKIWHERLQYQRPCMDLAHYIRIPWNIHAKLTRITGIRNINIPYHPKTGTKCAHNILQRQSQCHKEPFEPFKEERHDTVSQWLGRTLTSN